MKSITSCLVTSWRPAKCSRIPIASSSSSLTPNLLSSFRNELTGPGFFLTIFSATCCGLLPNPAIGPNRAASASSVPPSAPAPATIGAPNRIMALLYTGCIFPLDVRISPTFSPRVIVAFSLVGFSFGSDGSLTYRARSTPSGNSVSSE